MVNMIHFFVEKVKTKLAWKILFIYIGVILIPSIILGINYFSTVKAYMVREETDLNQRTLSQYCLDIDANLESAEKVYNQIQQHSNFLRFLLGEYTSNGAQASAYIAEFDTMFLYSFLSSRFIDSITVYMVNDSLLQMGAFLRGIDQLEDPQFDARTTAGYWRYDVKNKAVVYRKAIKSVTSNTILGILEVKCSENILLESLLKLESEDRRIFVEYDGVCYNLEGQREEPVKKSIEVSDGTRRIPLTARLETESTDANSEMIFSLLITFSCLIALSLILFFVVYRLSRRISRFSQSMAGYLTNSPKAYKDSGHDELSQLVKTYNDMVDNNDYLLNQVKIEKLHQQKTEYRALQSQIDPHFIYNSLEGIRMMAEMKDETEISDVIFSLSKLMRYAFSVTDSEVTLGLELDYVQQYINIQHMRFGEKIRYEVVCDSSLREINCPKFAIQPMVENAIKYGLGPGHGTVAVYVGVRLTEGTVYVEIFNTGQKIPEDRLYNINRLLRVGDSLKNFSSGTGIGLDNVNSRMRYLHRNSFFMHICNEAGGVSVKMEWNPEDKQ